jgi:hypothetical protein
MDSEYNTATYTDVQKPSHSSALAEIRGHEILDTHYAKGFHFGGVVDQKELNKQFRAKNANQLKNINDLKNSFGYF